jgi:L-lactate dehydrogenase
MKKLLGLVNPAAARKIAVVGVGAVGASVAYALMIAGLPTELVLVDANRAKAEGEAMDLSHAAAFVKPIRIYEGDYEDCRDADIIIFTAGAGQKPGEARLDLVQKNFAILKDSLFRMMPDRADTILLMVSNPVDVLTYAAVKITGLPPERVIGSGTVLDSSRFRHEISRHCGVDARNVHAYVVGEHGDSEVLLWSLANIAGAGIGEFCALKDIPSVNREEIDYRVRNAAYEIISRKGATYYAISLAVRRICESILRDEHSILTVSGLAGGAYGIDNCCLSLPAVVDARGRADVLALPLTGEEEKALHQSAEVLKGVIGKLGL